jgi:hypothetical protein
MHRKILKMSKPMSDERLTNIRNAVQAGLPLSPLVPELLAEVELLMEYADNPKDPTGTVYGYVPRKTVAKLLESHNGVVALAPVSERASNDYAKHLLRCVGIAQEHVEALEVL